MIMMMLPIGYRDTDQTQNGGGGRGKVGLNNNPMNGLKTTAVWKLFFDFWGQREPDLENPNLHSKVANAKH